jgi:outer membrane protein W
MTTRTLRIAFLTPLVVAGLVLVPVIAAAQQDAGSQPRKITRIAGRTTAISLEGAGTQSALQAQIRKYEADLRTAFAGSDWAGDVDAFFQAIAEGRAQKTSIPRGERIEWMAFRGKEGPTVMSDLEWAGQRPIDAWEVEVVSGTERARFMIPVICLNVSLLDERTDPELERQAREEARPSSCSVQATATCESKTLRIEVTSDVAVELTSVSLDGRAVSGARSTGAGTWELSPIENGVYSIVATATKPNGVTGTCQGRINVDCPLAVCRLDASWDATQRRIVIDSGGSVGEVSLTGVNLPDGGAGDLSRIESTGPGSWSFNPRRSLPRAAGNYTYTFAAEAELEGETASCSASASVPVEARADRWTLRLYGGVFDTDGEHLTTETTRTIEPAASGSSLVAKQKIPGRTRLDLGDGNGFGLGLEYRASDLLGVELSTFFGESDTGFLFDLGEEWEADDDSVTVRPTTLGLNFHLLRPDAPVDFYVGPVVGIVEYGDATFQALGETFRRDFDGDDFAWGVNLGLDVPFGASRWLFTTHARYLDSDTEVEIEGVERDVPVEPLFFTAGIGVRF